MKSLFAVLLLVTAFAASGCAPMGMSADLQVQSAPPPPTFQFSGDPQFHSIEGRSVSVIGDDSFGYDLFLSGGTYYLYNADHWYRSPDARGPFIAVDARRVPRSIFDVDDHDYRWRNHPKGWRGGRHPGNNHGHDGGPGNDRGGH